MRMLEILEKIVNQQADFNDLTNLNILARTIKQTSLCGLGQTAPNLVLSSIKKFFSDYEEKIKDEQKRFYYYINEEKCTGCHICFEVCPKKAISGKPREIHNINQDLCIRCGMCYNSCPIKSIEKKNIK